MGTEYKKFEWSDDTSNYVVKVRNVGNLNPAAQIQITLEEYDRLRKRTVPFRELSVPQKFAKEFINAVSGIE